MDDTIPARSNEPCDPALFAIPDRLPSDCLRDNANALGAPVSVEDDRKTRIERALDDLVVAESWESMALESAARSKPHVAIQCKGR
jgi:hypothetical protein